MKNINKKLLSLPVVAIVASLLVAGGVKLALATGAPPVSLASGAKPRVNNAVSAGSPLDKAAKGVKVFGADVVATRVFDEQGTSPSTGGLASLEIGSATNALIGSGCYLMVFDSSVASDTTEANSQARLLAPPLLAVVSSNAIKEFAYPKQFHKGLVVLVGGTTGGCKATIGWLRNGGDN